MSKDPNSVTRERVVANLIVDRLVQRKGRHKAKKGSGLLVGLQLDRYANSAEQNRALRLLLDEERVSVEDQVLTLIEAE